MTGIKMQLGAIAAAFFALGYSMPAPATAAAVSITSSATDFSAERRGGGGGGRNVNR